MSVFSIGANDPTEEQQAFKKQLSTQDSRIAAQQNQILKQAAELEEIKSTLNDALYKLHHETTRALSLEKDLSRCTDDLNKEKMLCQNKDTSLIAANQKLRIKELETRDLEATLDSMSHQSDQRNSNGNKLQKEKGVLEARVRELEAELRLLSSAPVTPGRQRTPARGRSSSLSNLRITSLETELTTLRASLAQKEAELHAKDLKLTAIHGNLVQVENEKTAIGRESQRELKIVRDLLEEKDEELQYLRNASGGGEREEELLKRIEEDEAKISALEAMLEDSQDVKALKSKLKWTEDKLEEEINNAESRDVELVRQKEEALDELEEAHARIASMTCLVRDRDASIRALEQAVTERQSTQDDSESSTDSVVHIERLLTAIQRLRNERDNLVRDVQFLESEHRFTVEALEAKVSKSAEHDEATATATVDIQTQPLHSQLEAANKTIDNYRAQSQGLARRFLASAVIIQRLESSVQSVPDESAAENPQHLLLAEKLNAAETKLGITIQCLEEATDERNNLMSRLDLLERDGAEELEEVKLAYRELQDVVKTLEDRLADASKSFEEVESERNSLSLQLTNLTNELSTANRELEDAEGRYSTLQFHQLSHMTSTEATRTLRNQLEEMELRVARRTEQIGIHQHDIRRMETNLRLQEERLTEMTAEMETLAAQKAAMVEDCADAREARDDALTRMENMELDVEVMEGRLQETEAALQAMVQALLETVVESKQGMRDSNADTLRLTSQLDELTVRYEETCQLLQNRVADVDELRARLEAAGSDARHVAVALAVSQLDLKGNIASSQAVDSVRLDLEKQLVVLQSHLDIQCAETQSMMTQLNNLRSESAKSTTGLETRLEEREHFITELEAQHQSIVDSLQHRLNQSADGEELVKLQMQHIEEIGRYKSLQEEALMTADESKARYASLETDYQQILSESSQLKLTLEAHGRSEIDQAQIREEQAKEIVKLRTETERLDGECQAARKSLQELEDARLKTATDHAEALQQQLSRIQHLDDMVTELESELRNEHQQSEGLVHEVDGLREQLQLEVDERARAEAQSEELKSLLARGNSTESQLNEDLSILRAQLDQANGELDLLQEEKTTLQQNVTALEAEYQRSVSLTRYLERQVKDSELQTTQLSADLERCRLDLARVQRSSNTAEVNLGLLGAQHKREMSQLQRELDSLKSRPNLEQAVDELRERNEEMEELLRVKCREIEDNDDRALEMLKENKKLIGRLDILNRKVQNLQAKLVAVKATAPVKASPEPSPVDTGVGFSRPRSNTLASVPAMQPSATPINRNRMVSGPSSLPRPKTPERKLAVFKARSPEKKPIVDSPVTPIAGKKRPAPDEFDDIPSQAFTVDCAPSDTPDSGSTPRVRNVLSSIQSGFTPTRNRLLSSPKRGDFARSSFMPELPQNLPTTPQIVVTPADKPTKRSWLGKIRGNSTTQATTRRTFQ
ncbi:hypothetical protein C8J56DRAFT_319481 [Mycena floridula]|nr:hypothetical protein C8J56DRAFT_319481 [Mycena floridula]